MVADVAFTNGPASVFGTDRTLEPGHASLLNASACVSSEFEEGLLSRGHVGAAIDSGGFALAEQYDVNGQTFLDACIRACEICARFEDAIMEIRTVINEEVPWYIRDQHSNAWMTIGPALAGALCLDLDEDRFREVLRISANLAVVGLYDLYFDTTPIRNYTTGFRTQAGVSTVLLGAAGLTGSTQALEGVYNPLRDMMDGEFERMFAELGTEWHLERIYFKPWPTCGHNRPVITALKEIADEVDVKSVESIEVHTYSHAVDMMGGQDPEWFTQAKFSTPYAVARYIVSGDIDFEHFEANRIRESDVQSLADRVTLHVDPEHDAVFPDQWGATVKIDTDDGSTLSATCDAPIGGYRNPLPDADLHEKFHAALLWGVDEEYAVDALEMLLKIPEQDVRTVGAALRTD